MRKSLGILAGLALMGAALSESAHLPFDEGMISKRQKTSGTFTKLPMTNKQKRARAASNRAGKARKINR